MHIHNFPINERAKCFEDLNNYFRDALTIQDDAQDYEGRNQDKRTKHNDGNIRSKKVYRKENGPWRRE